MNSSPAPGSAEKTSLSRALVMVLAVVVLAGALFGYDQGVISGALTGIRKDFSLSPLLVETVTSWVTLGALVGSLCGGYLADRFGRRRALLYAGVLFIAGALIEALAPSVSILVVGRFVVGFGVGIAAVAAPLYSSELAPTAWRGRFVSAYQLAITAGIFFSYLIDEQLASTDAWRWMLGASGAVGVLLFLAVLPAEESPRWLIKMGRRTDALAALQRIRPGANPAVRLNAYEAAMKLDATEATWSEVFQARWRRPLVVGLGLAIFQQITGINAIIYYANRIFEAAGFATAAAQTHATTWAIGGVNVLATLIAIAFIDRLGRRPLLLAGLVGMGASLLSVGLAFRAMGAPTSPGGPSTAGIVTLVSLVIFMISFAFSLGPVVWTVISEIFPQKVRGRAIAIATAVNWGAAFLVSQFFLSLVERIGESSTFLLFAFFCVVGWIWVFRNVPETKGKTLEEIEGLWSV